MGSTTTLTALLTLLTGYLGYPPAAGPVGRRH